MRHRRPRPRPRRRALAGLASVPLLALAALAPSCAEPADAAGGPLVGFSQIGAESDWRAAETASIRAEAGRRGVRLKLADAQGDQQKQIQALRSFAAQGVDAVLLAPVVESGWEPVLRELRDEGIPVVLVDRGVAVGEPGLYATLIASDFVEEGRRAGRWLVEACGGAARVVELRGTPGSAPANDRRRGFAEAIAAAPGVTVVHSQAADFTRSRGKEVMEAVVKALPGGFDAMYAHNDDMALGAIQSLEDAGLDAGGAVRVVSIDGVRAALEAIVAGDLSASVECNPLLGPAAFDAVERLLAGEPLPERIVVEDEFFSAENAAAALPTREY